MMVKTTRTALLLLERSRDLRQVLERPGAHRIVALSPEAMESLEASAIAYSIPEDYGGVDELVELGSKNFQWTAELCSALDEFIRDTGLGTIASGLNAASCIYTELKLLRDAVLFRIEALGRIIRTEQPAEVVYFGTEPEPFRPDLQFVEESLYSRLIKLVAQEQSVPARVLGQAATAKAPQRARGPAWKRLTRRLAGSDIYAALGLASSIGGIRLKAWRHRPPDTVLVIGGGRELVPVLREWARSGKHRVVAVTDSGRAFSVAPLGLMNHRARSDLSRRAAVAAECEAIWKRLTEQQWFRGAFSLGNIDAYPVVESRLKWFVTRQLPQIVETYLKADDVITQHRPRVALTSGISGCGQRATIASARQRGTPIVGYQHGGFYGYARFPMHYYNDLALVDRFAVYGAGVKGGLERMFLDTRSARPVLEPIGSAAVWKQRTSARPDKTRWAKRHGLDSKRQVVVYAPTIFTGNFGYLPGSYPDCLYYRLQLRLVDVASRHPDAQLVVKAPLRHWSHSPLGEYIARRRLSNVVQIENEPLPAVLRCADACIIDWPSTALLEALAAGIPIVALADRRIIPLEEEALSLLGQATDLAQDEEQFLALVEELFARGPTRSLTKDQGRERFLERYVFGGNGDGVLKRSVAWLDSIISSSAAMSPEAAPAPVSG